MRFDPSRSRSRDMVFAVALWVAVAAIACGNQPEKSASVNSATASASMAPASLASVPVASASALSVLASASAVASEMPVEDAPPVLRRPVPVASVNEPPRGPRVTVAPIVSEEMDTAEREGIERALRKNEPRFIACYQKGLSHDATLEGTLGARVSIGSAGNVVKKIGTTLRDEETVGCVLAELKSMTFPLPQKRAPVVVPLRFER